MKFKRNKEQMIDRLMQVAKNLNSIEGIEIVSYQADDMKIYDPSIEFKKGEHLYSLQFMAYGEGLCLSTYGIKNKLPFSRDLTENHSLSKVVEFIQEI